jgi:glycerol-3-phosphate acyltransferase PlsY
MPAAIVLLLIVWALIFFTTRYVSLASIIAAAVLPLLTHLGARFHHIDNNPDLPTLWEAGTWNKPLFAFSVLIAGLAIWKHRSNIQRLRNGTENRFKKKS